MSNGDFPESVKKLIYESIDSVSVLEALILVSTTKDKSWTAETLSAETRSSLTSAANCLEYLLHLGVIEESTAIKGAYLYSPKDPKLAEVIESLPQLYQTKPRRMLELIFSPLKQARVIADGFCISPKKGNKNG